MEELGETTCDIALIVDKCYHGSNRDDIGEDVRACNRKVRQVVHRHLSVVRLALIDKEMSNDELKRVAQEDKSKVVAFHVHWRERHVLKTVCKVSSAPHKPGLPRFAINHIPMTDSAECV